MWGWIFPSHVPLTNKISIPIGFNLVKTEAEGFRTNIWPAKLRLKNTSKQYRYFSTCFDCWSSLQTPLGRSDTCVQSCSPKASVFTQLLLESKKTKISEKKKAFYNIGFYLSVHGRTVSLVLKLFKSNIELIKRLDKTNFIMLLFIKGEQKAAMKYVICHVLLDYLLLAVGCAWGTE